MVQLVFTLNALIKKKKFRGCFPLKAVSEGLNSKILGIFSKMLAGLLGVPIILCVGSGGQAPMGGGAKIS